MTAISAGNHQVVLALVVEVKKREQAVVVVRLECLLSETTA